MLIYYKIIIFAFDHYNCFYLFYFKMKFLTNMLYETGYIVNAGNFLNILNVNLHYY